MFRNFDTRWDGILSSMSKIPSDDILESLYKLIIRASDQLKKCIRIVRTWKIIKRYRLRNFDRQKRDNWDRTQWLRVAGALSGIERGDFEFAIIGNAERSSVQRGDQWSFWHEDHERAKPTPITAGTLWTTNTKRWKCIEEKEPQSQESIWEVQSTAVPRLLERY